MNDFKKNVGVDLSSRDAAVQVFSALLSLTTVFGMGTGGPSTSSTPTHICLHAFYVSLSLLVTRSGFEPLLPA